MDGNRERAVSLLIRALHHTAVWTGSEMIVWGGADGIGSYSNDGGRYNPGTEQLDGGDHHRRARRARYDHTAVWTGSEMIVWGGYGGVSYLNDGGRYNPAAEQLDGGDHHRRARRALLLTRRCGRAAR